jgi:hypothetical protein
MPAEEKLFPCPFCGGKAIMMIAVPFNGHRIECEHHCCLQTFSSRDMAVYRWNRRANIKECARQQPTTAAAQNTADTVE